MRNAEKVRYQKTLDGVETSATPNHIIRYFPDVFLGNGHKGLSALASKNGIDVRNLRHGEFLMFVNKQQTALKLFVMGNVVAYLKIPGSERINPKVITMIPRFFNGTEINYNKALRAALSKYYAPQVSQ